MRPRNEDFDSFAAATVTLMTARLQAESIGALTSRVMEAALDMDRHAAELHRKDGNSRKRMAALAMQAYRAADVPFASNTWDPPMFEA